MTKDQRICMNVIYSKSVCPTFPMPPEHDAKKYKSQISEQFLGIQRAMSMEHVSMGCKVAYKKKPSSSSSSSSLAGAEDTAGCGFGA